MPSPMTPAQLERKIAAVMRRVLGSREADVMSALERGGDWQKALDKLYAAMQKELEAELGPLLKDGVLGSALRTMDAEDLALDAARLGRRAEKFVESYTFDLVKGITDTTRDRLSNAMTTFLDDGSVDLRTLAERVGKVFGSARGQMIATTEATRASAQGQRVLAKELKAENPDAKVQELWQTSEDEMVCPVCGPKNGKQIRGNDVPPAHPNCRCAVRIVVLSVGGKNV